MYTPKSIYTPTQLNMDAGSAYNQHSSEGKRRSRSSTNLKHLSLAPLTAKLPINDSELIFSDLAVQTNPISYIQGKSAPTTPSLLNHSPLRPIHRNHRQSRQTSGTPLPKSKSTTHLSRQGRAPRSGTTTPGGPRRGVNKDEPVPIPNRSDRDWLLRAGVLISSEARESKGQSWLVSRASSTSLTGMRGPLDDEEDGNANVFERDRIARESAIASRHASRRGSLAPVEVDHSPLVSRRGSLYASRTSSHSQLATPSERAAVDGYFEAQARTVDNYAPGPDFVNLDEKLEYIDAEGDMGLHDEADLRMLVKSGHARPGSWLGNILDWTLFSVDEDDEDEEGEAEGTDGEAEASLPETCLERQFEGVRLVSEQSIPAPKADEGGWQDAAWLLSLASKVAWS